MPERAAGEGQQVGEDGADGGGGERTPGGHVIGEIAVPLLYDRLPGLRTDPRRAEDWFGWVFRGLTSLPVTWGTR